MHQKLLFAGYVHGADIKRGLNKNANWTYFKNDIKNMKEHYNAEIWGVDKNEKLWM